MVHRYKLSLRKLFGPNDTLVTGVTVTQNGEQTVVPVDQDFGLKNIVLPVQLKFEPADNSEIIDKWVEDQTNKAINKSVDGETIRYRGNTDIEFRFLDRGTNEYVNSYFFGGDGGFESTDFLKKRFTKSFFRIYFYDVRDSEVRNLLFVEQFDVVNTDVPNFSLDRLYWLKNDEFFDGNVSDRKIFMDARFFNAKNGFVHRFINIPESITTPLTLEQYRNNPEWRGVEFTLKNPILQSNPKYRFESNDEIVMTELIIQ